MVKMRKPIAPPSRIIKSTKDKEREARPSEKELLELAEREYGKLDEALLRGCPLFCGSVILEKVDEHKIRGVCIRCGIVSEAHRSSNAVIQDLLAKLYPDEEDS